MPSGCIFALWVHPLDGAAIMDKVGKPDGFKASTIEGMHVTMSYLGEADKLQDRREELQNVANRVAFRNKMIKASVGGFGRFTATGSDDGDAVYASVDSPELVDLYQAIRDELEASGFEVEPTHGFTPHITLGYLKAEDDLPEIESLNMPITFEGLTLAFAGEHHTAAFSDADSSAPGQRMKVVDEARTRMFFKAMPSPQADGDNVIDVLYIPYLKRDDDENWFDKRTRFHLTGFNPGVLDFHGAAFGGEVKERGEVTQKWEDEAGHWAQIALDPDDPKFPEYTDALKAGRLFVSPGVIPGYFNYEPSGYVTDWATGEISLIVADGTKRPKNWYAVARPRAEAMLKAAALSYQPLFDNVSVVGGSTTPTPAQAALNPGPPVPNLYSTATDPLQPKTVRRINPKLRKAIQRMLRAFGFDADYINLKLNALTEESILNDLDGADGNAPSDSPLSRHILAGLKAFALATSDDATTSGEIFIDPNGPVGEMNSSDATEAAESHIDLQVADAGGEQPLAEAEGNTMSENTTPAAGSASAAPAETVQPVDGGAPAAAPVATPVATPVAAVVQPVATPVAAPAPDSRVNDLEAQVAALNEQIASRDDTAWFDSLVRDGKAAPAERETALAGMKVARRADAMVKGGPAGMVTAFKASYESRAAMPMSNNGEGLRLAGFGQGGDADTNTDGAVRAILASTDQGRSALKKMDAPTA